MSFKKPFRATPVVLGPYAKRQEQRNRRGEFRFPAIVAGGMALTSMIVWTLTDPALQSAASATAVAPQPRTAGHVFYLNCSDARTAGAAPIYRGQPGYREEMDGDLDGIACEPPPRRLWR